MVVDGVCYSSDYKRKVTTLRHEIPLDERKCFAFFAEQLAKLRKHTETAVVNGALGAYGIFPLVKTSHEKLLRAVYNKSGEITQKKMRELVEYVKSTGFTGFDI